MGSGPAYQWDWTAISEFFPLLLEGLRLTLIVTLVSCSCGLLLGLPVALTRMSRFRVLRAIATAYIEIFRGTPFLIQLVWFYYALPAFTGLSFSAVTSASIAMSLNLAAFAGEAYRAGIQSIAKEQIEAAVVLGLSPINRIRYLIVPQGLRNVFPVLVSMSVQLFKDTSLVSTLGVADLMFNAQSAATTTYRPLETLTTAALMYFVIAFPFTVIMRKVEVRLDRHNRPVKEDGKVAKAPVLAMVGADSDAMSKTNADNDNAGDSDHQDR